MAFVRVARLADIPEGRGRLVKVRGLSLAVFRAGGGRVFACGALCPHEDGPLADGWLESTVAVCPWHGFDFDLEPGRCLVADGLSVPVYPARVVGDDVEVDVP